MSEVLPDSAGSNAADSDSDTGSEVSSLDAAVAAPSDADSPASPAEADHDGAPQLSPASIADIGPDTDLLHAAEAVGPDTGTTDIVVTAGQLQIPRSRRPHSRRRKVLSIILLVIFFAGFFPGAIGGGVFDSQAVAQLLMEGPHAAAAERRHRGLTLRAEFFGHPLDHRMI